MDLPQDPAAWAQEPLLWPDGTPGWHLRRPGIALGVSRLGPATLETGLLQETVGVEPDGRLARFETFIPLVTADMMPDRRADEDDLAWALRAAALAAGAPAQALQRALDALALAWAATTTQEVRVGIDSVFALSAVRTDGPGDRLLRRIASAGALREALVLLCTPARRRRPSKAWRLEVRCAPPPTAHERAAALAHVRQTLDALGTPSTYGPLADLLPPGA